MQKLKMKLKSIALLTLGILATRVEAEDKAVFKDQKDKLSYSIGMNWGNSLKRDEIDVNLDQIIAGLRSGMAGKAKATRISAVRRVKVFMVIDSARAGTVPSAAR